MSLLLSVVVAGPLRLAFGGDIMLNAVSPKAKPLAAVAPFFKKVDLSFANLEIPLTDLGTVTSRKTAKELRERNQFVLRASPLHAPNIAASGIGMVSLANNHCMDYGALGLSKMLSVLTLPHAGAGSNWKEATQVTVKVLPDGRKVGLLSALCFVGRNAILKTTPATKNQPGISVLSFNGVLNKKAKEQLSNWIGNAKKQCDYLVVATHWGIERKSLPSSYQVSLGRALADAGADVVWGHHPHVLEGAEIYHGVPILYSMGNLVSPTPAKTGIVYVTLDDQKKPKLSFLACTVSGGKVTPDKKQAAGLKTFSSLCEMLRRKYPQPKATG